MNTTYIKFKAGRDFKQSSNLICEHIFINMKHIYVLSVGSGPRISALECAH